MYISTSSIGTCFKILTNQKKLNDLTNHRSEPAFVYYNYVKRRVYTYIYYKLSIDNNLKKFHLVAYEMTYFVSKILPIFITTPTLQGIKSKNRNSSLNIYYMNFN